MYLEMTSDSSSCKSDSIIMLSDDEIWIEKNFSQSGVDFTKLFLLSEKFLAHKKFAVKFQWLKLQISSLNWRTFCQMLLAITPICAPKKSSLPVKKSLANLFMKSTPDEMALQQRLLYVILFYLSALYVWVLQRSYCLLMTSKDY